MRYQLYNLLKRFSSVGLMATAAILSLADAAAFAQTSAIGGGNPAAAQNGPVTDRVMQRGERAVTRTSRDAASPIETRVNPPVDRRGASRDSLRDGTSQIVEGDRVRLGVTFDDRVVDEVTLRSVTENSAAYAAGLRAGDQIVSINGQTFNTYRDAATYIRQNSNVPFSIMVNRDGRQMSFQAAIGPSRNLRSSANSIDTRGVQPRGPSSSQLGAGATTDVHGGAGVDPREPNISVDELARQQGTPRVGAGTAGGVGSGANGGVGLGVIFDESVNGGLVVSRVERGSPAYVAGLRTGDVINALDGRTISSYRDVTNYLSGLSVNDRMAIRLTRGGQPMNFNATLAARDSVFADNARAAMRDSANSRTANRLDPDGMNRGVDGTGAGTAADGTRLDRAFDDARIRERRTTDPATAALNNDAAGDGAVNDGVNSRLTRPDRITDDIGDQFDDSRSAERRRADRAFDSARRRNSDIPANVNNGNRITGTTGEFDGQTATNRSDDSEQAAANPSLEADGANSPDDGQDFSFNDRIRGNSDVNDRLQGSDRNNANASDGFTSGVGDDTRDTSGAVGNNRAARENPIQNQNGSGNTPTTGNGDVAIGAANNGSTSTNSGSTGDTTGTAGSTGSTSTGASQGANVVERPTFKGGNTSTGANRNATAAAGSNNAAGAATNGAVPQGSRTGAANRTRGPVNRNGTRNGNVPTGAPNRNAIGNGSRTGSGAVGTGNGPTNAGAANRGAAGAGSTGAGPTGNGVGTGARTPSAAGGTGTGGAANGGGAAGAGGGAGAGGTGGGSK